jgi:hypothetical protein
MKRLLGKRQFRKARANALVDYLAENCQPVDFANLVKKTGYAPMCWSREETMQAVEDLVDEGRACVVAHGSSVIVVVPEATGSDQAYWANFVAKNGGWDATGK